MSPAELSFDSPYRSNESGILAHRHDQQQAWQLERAIDAQLLLPIVARRWALAFTAPIATLLTLVAVVQHDWERMWLPGLLTLPSFLVLSWAARTVLATRLAWRPLDASPLDRLAGLAACYAPWARSSAMILGAATLWLVARALSPFEAGGDAVKCAMVLSFYSALSGAWTVPTLLLRSFQIGFRSARRGFLPLTIVCGLGWSAFWVPMLGFGALLPVLLGGAAMYGAFALVERLVRLRFDRDDAIVAALLHRRAAASAP
jgi:hypothetical protein